MNSRLRNNLVVCVVASLAGGALAAAYSIIVEGDPLVGMVTGAAITAPLVAFEMFIMRGPTGATLRHLPLWALTLVSALVWVLTVLFGILTIPPIVMDVDAYPDWYFETGFVQDVVVAMLVVVLVNFTLRIHSLVGTRVLVNFLLGRYHRPLREEQIFMFVDFLDARGMSRRLGDLKAQSLIAAAFFDIDDPVREFGGETHRYIADELVVTWPLARGAADGRCIACALRILEVLSANAGRYRRDFGEAPRLRVALHGGPVVVSEIGDERREIVYFGDTINTTARLRGLAKKIGRSLVISASLLEQSRLPDGARADDMGEYPLSGKAGATRVFAVEGA